VLPPAAAIPARLARLTNREREVLAFLVQGLSTKEIGRALGVSPRTIEVHRGRLMSKMEARNGVDLVRLVMGAASRPAELTSII
jgi:FixJ family two-component response regulator